MKKSLLLGVMTAASLAMVGCVGGGTAPRGSEEPHAAARDDEDNMAPEGSDGQDEPEIEFAYGSEPTR